ncbi:MAG: hypothetical protein V3W34_17800 [Phycisphaerae bacterium]
MNRVGSAVRTTAVRTTAVRTTAVRATPWPPTNLAFVVRTADPTRLTRHRWAGRP